MYVIKIYECEKSLERVNHKIITLLGNTPIFCKTGLFYFILNHFEPCFVKINFVFVFVWISNLIVRNLDILV